MRRPADEDLIGRTIAGKFEVLSFLGGGAMGAVYKAYQPSIEKYVAIKVLHRDLVTHPTFVMRFEREAKAASLLDHGNLMRVVDYGRETDGSCYIAMELLEGRNLYQLLKDDGPLHNERIVELLRQTLAGLAVAHEMGVIHRDLKPENIIVLERRDDDGEGMELVKVCDFGMAKMIHPDGAAEGPRSSEKLTSQGVAVGTPDYMSPEQGRGEPLDARSDLYSVGIILYQMLAGRLPFPAETPIGTLLRHVIDEPVPPSEIVGSVHPGLERVCLRALAKKPEDRFQSAREMRSELRIAVEGHRVSGYSHLPRSRSVIGSVSDGEFAAFDLRPPQLPRNLDIAGASSSRIRALDAVELAEPRGRWLLPSLVAIVLTAATGLFMTAKHRSAAARATATHHVPKAPPSTLPPESRVAPGAPAPSQAEDDLESSHAVPALPRGNAAPSYATPTTGAVVLVGPAHVDSPASASASPSANATAFTGLTVPEVPKIEHASGLPAASSAGGGGPDVPAAPVDAVTHARVSLGAVHADGVAVADVLQALPSARFDRCYRKTLAGAPLPFGGSGTLRLAIDSAGHIGSASFVGTDDLATVGQCVANAAIGNDLRNPPGGPTSAEVDLAFRPE